MTTTRKRALLALLLLTPAPSLGTLGGMWLFPGLFGQIIYGLCKVWLLGFPLIWLYFVEHKSWSSSPPRQGGLGMGVLLGLLMGGIIVGIYGVFGRDAVDTEHLREMAHRNGFGTAMLYLGLAFYLTLINSLLEEYVWRWFVFRRSEELLSARSAVALSALLFTVHHTVALLVQFGWGVTLAASVGVFVSGLVWSGCYVRYRSIWPGYLSHILADAAIFLVGWWLIFG
ncbi:MAG TPA: CPBP family intramembrane glutamic endopeptidase [Gemmataceae bacterium]|nr:CPBP family intramembrane glutamic endopeptidase [Gemmataceae bacterium]